MAGQRSEPVVVPSVLVHSEAVDFEVSVFPGSSVSWIIVPPGASGARRPVGVLSFWCGMADPSLLVPAVFCFGSIVDDLICPGARAVALSVFHQFLVCHFRALFCGCVA